ncbi:type III-A CRISPR-associated RAMP protein Csm3 [Thermodesulforhabdus norvegica]|uniref:CRISPR system Cms endoribonuclease Csm3 n=1 Tax=Thermodesulforhabdus norvegica TaxID=39841 RepID=A0A1I4S7H8_9BACT|nr:type III-A CRISPR-associated RAMP protein Csm3 [Thermodesulforhabdus norvegica]SFM60419.1 CRISPR-associated protein, Csm3 family [Thermodesulforhabdus norvegica]
MKLIAIKEYRGTIELKTGLHIGAGDIEMHIGGTDNPVVKHPFTFEPYIPGSSLKGKIRSLLELKSGLIAYTEGKPLSIKSLENANGNSRKLGEAIIKIFGTSGAEEEALKGFGPTRISVSDCMLSERCREQAREGKMVLTEVKPENSINRITGTAQNPRFTERVPAGVEFDFFISLKIFDGDDSKYLEKVLLEGMKLLELDTLGGNGSRGYGRIKFHFENSNLQKRFEEILPFSKE